MDYWYLVSSLPHLSFGEKPAMSVDAFRAACVGWLSEEQLAVIHDVLENQEPSAGVASAWWNGEVQLCNAVVRVRAKKRGADASRFLKTYNGFNASIEKRVADAFTRSDPLEQEMDLDRIRWSLVNELALAEPFGFAAVLAFAVNVRIAERWATMDEHQGLEKVEELVLSAL